MNIRLLVPLSLLALLILLAFLFDSLRAGKPAEYDSDTQADYNSSIALDRTSLADGYIKYPGAISAYVNKSTVHTVRICGPEAGASDPGCSNHSDPPPQANGQNGEGPVASSTAPPPKTGPVKTGARVQVRLSSTMPGEVSPVSTEIQPIVERTDTAEWHWNIKPQKSGMYIVTATITTLAEDTNEPLVPDRTVVTTIQASETPGSILAKAGQRVSTFFTSLFGIMSSLGLTAVLIASWLARNRTRRRLRHRKRAAVAASNKNDQRSSD